VTSALLQGSGDAELGLFEVDEAALPEIARRAPPRSLLLANLFRDQLDRYGELRLLQRRWRETVDALPAATRLLVGADDPAVADLGAGRPGVVTFGFDDPRHALPVMDHAADSAFCVRCGTGYTYAAVYLGHLGDYRCPGCGMVRPALDFAARDVRLDGLAPTRFRLDTPDGPYPVTLGLPGIYNVYNAVAAVALAASLGVPPSRSVPRLAEFRAAFGRFERLELDDRGAVLLLVKNPAGANEALRTLAPALPGGTLMVALNDRIADGRDVSWIWDVDLEATAPLARTVVCSGTRAADLAVRMRYAGVEPDRIEVVDDLPSAFDRACALAGPGGTAFVLPTYTAMLALQRLASDRGLTRPYWEARA
jgi:UDP-N-acetylmuramyl tripeptide synthase